MVFFLTQVDLVMCKLADVGPIHHGTNKGTKVHPLSGSGVAGGPVGLPVWITAMQSRAGQRPAPRRDKHGVKAGKPDLHWVRGYNRA